jgi:hypothetical protein
MLAKKHEAIYTENLEPIRQMLLTSGPGVRPYSIYLGNWMTDMSQVYDPGVAKFILSLLSAPFKALEPLMDLLADTTDRLVEVDRTIESILAARDAAPPPPSPDGLIRFVVSLISEAETLALKVAHAGLHAFTAEFLELMIDLRRALTDLQTLELQPDPTRETMELLYCVVMTNALFKFGMNPYDADRSIAPGEVVRLFETYFGSYKPYQHLDRHLDAEAVKTVSADAIDKDFACYVASKAERSEHGMKDYLRDGVLTAAGHLNGLSSQRRTSFSNDDLVKLGMSLHALEDFFAHSNYLERLIVANGRKDGLWTDGLNPLEMSKLTTANIGLKYIPCLFRHLSALRAAQRPDLIRPGLIEPNLVTGYFTPEDAKHSLFSVVADGILSIFDDQIDDGRTLGVLDVLEQVFVNEPTKEIDRLKAIDRNLSGLATAEHVWVEDGDIETVLAQAFQDAPPELVRVLRRTANAWIGLVTGFKVARDLGGSLAAAEALILAVKTAIRIVRLVVSARSKVTTCLKLLSPILEKLGRVLLKESAMQLAAWLTDLTLSNLKKAMLEEPAIGSHSSIAKDDRLGKNGLYQKVHNFAVAVDALVINHLRQAAAEGDEAGDEAAPVVRWDTTLLKLLADPFKVYAPPQIGTPRVKAVDILTLSREELTPRLLGAARGAGYASPQAFEQALLSLNPTVGVPADGGGGFVYRRGPATQTVLVPYAKPQPGLGWQCLPQVEVIADWRHDIYFGRTAALSGYLERASPTEVKDAQVDNEARARDAFHDYEAITRKLFPAAAEAGICWGYCGFSDIIYRASGRSSM